MLVWIVRVDSAVGGVDGKQYRAAEAVTLGEDFGQHWQAFLRPVFFIAGNEHDVLSGPGPVTAFVNDPRIVGTRLPVPGTGQSRQQNHYPLHPSLVFMIV